MLTRLRLINFRRHQDTELDLSEDAQIIAITGRNGAGKSSLLEGILFALYGESRHGRRGLAKMVRRGAEFEGMQVELAMTVGGVEYEITRRYERGKSSAVMFAGGNKAMESPDGVTAEVTRLLGMDAVGFRLAVIAQQFDVDGLADLTPAKRKATITRLLRQDAITTAAKNARDIRNRELDIVRAFGAGPDFTELEAEASAAEQEVAGFEAARDQSRAVLADLDAELEATEDVEAAWRAAELAVARAQTKVEAGEAEVARIQADLDRVRVPELLAEATRPLIEITGELSEVNIQIAQGQAAKERAEQAATTRADLDRVLARLAQLDQEVGEDTPATVAMQVAKVAGQISGKQEAIAELEAARQQLRTDYGAAQARLALLQEREAAAAALGDVCTTCEQAVSGEHKEAQARVRKAEREELTAELERLTAEGEAASARISELAAKVAELARERDALTRRRGVVESAANERRELTVRKEQYEARLSRIQVEEVDLDSLYERKGLLEVERAQAEQAEEVARLRVQALERKEALRTALEQAGARLQQAREELELTTPGTDLAAAHARRQEKVAARSAEAELVAAVETDLAAARERLRSVQRAQADARAQAARAAKHRKAADTAAKAAQVLAETAARMSTQIRPALEGEISTILQQLSEGRFTAVKVSDDYEITVEDDGAFQPLTEFSGGESVLIALATRLALANIVAGRQGTGRAGFLILDEVFGSQDEGRREAILTGLRSLRALYGQILLISHVGGLEETADRVLEVDVEEVDGRRVAEVRAA
jgi:exonuclease SbcC